jgi:hypothetical protein
VGSLHDRSQAMRADPAVGGASAPRVWEASADCRPRPQKQHDKKNGPSFEEPSMDSMITIFFPPHEPVAAHEPGKRASWARLVRKVRAVP